MGQHDTRHYAKIPAWTRIAAGDNHTTVVVKLARSPDQVARLGISGTGDGTGINNDQLRPIIEWDNMIPGVTQRLLHGRRFELVGFTA